MLSGTVSHSQPRNQRKTLVCLSAVLVVGGLVSQPASAQQKSAGDFYSAAGTVFTLGSGGTVGRLAAALAWTCNGSRLQVIYVWDKYLAGVSNAVNVTFMVDQGEPVSGSWQLRPDHLSAEMPRNLVSRFTDRTKAGRTATLAVRDPVDGETLLDAFSMMGLTQSLPRLPCTQ